MTEDLLGSALAQAGSMDELCDLLPRAQVGPGWAKPAPSVYPEPNRVFVPAQWKYAQARPALNSAARFVNTELAERRNLIMINPHDGNDYATARTLVAAYQLVRAGEVARSHRHTPNALRLVLDAAPDTFTIVNGHKIPMLPGDVLLTPNWCWHGHSNESHADAFWIDFLDVPLIHLLEPMFFERYPERIEESGAAEPDSPMRFAYCECGPAVRAQAETRPGERWLELGPPKMATIGLDLRHLSEGAEIHDPKTTVNCIYAVIDGRGTMESEGQCFSWSRGDVLVVPAWARSNWSCAEDACLLRVSDEPILAKLGLIRTEAPAVGID